MLAGLRYAEQIMGDLMTERVNWIDIAKSIGIILVVMGHLDNPEKATTFIYAFHMPLFFFLSGMTFKNNQKFKNYITKKTRTILIPYFLFALLTYLFWLFIGKHFGEDANMHLSLVKPLVGILYANGIDNWLSFNVPLWYLPCLFIVEISFFYVSKANSTIRFAILVVLGILGYLLSLTTFVRLPWSINVAFTAIVIYGIGNFAYTIISQFEKHKILSIISGIFLLGLTYAISRVNGRIDMNANHYGNVLLFYCGAFCGILAIINFSQVIPNSNTLIFIGRNTLVILALHGIIISLIKGVMLLVLKIDLSILNDNLLINIFLTLIIVCISFPLIVLINTYIPELVGRKRLTTAST
jgi:fucose 4-O-acetylase-like acetyltransferase